MSLLNFPLMHYADPVLKPNFIPGVQ